MFAADAEMQLWGEDDRSNQPWSVHDGQFFAEHVRDGAPAAPMERRLVENDQLQAWVDSCTDFLSSEGMSGLSPTTLGKLPSPTPFDGMLGQPSDDQNSSTSCCTTATVSPPNDGKDPTWTVHDGQFFAAHVREKRPRAPAERQLSRQQDQPKRWRHGPRTSAAGDLATAQPIPVPPSARALDAAARARQYAADLAHQKASLERQAAAVQAAQVTQPPPPAAALGGAMAAQGAMACAQALPAAPAPWQAMAAAATQPVISATAMPVATPLLPAPQLPTIGLHKGLLDLIPSAVLVRTSRGELLYANRMGTDAVGVAPGGLPANWQIVPQRAATTNPSRILAGGKVAESELSHELDLPRDPIRVPPEGKGSLPPLPPATQGFSLMLLGTDGAKRFVLRMHRIPFYQIAGAGPPTRRGGMGAFGAALMPCPEALPLMPCPVALPVMPCPEALPVMPCPEALPLMPCPEALPLMPCPEALPVMPCPEAPVPRRGPEAQPQCTAPMRAPNALPQ